MEPELWVAVAAVFVSGGALGTAGTLLAQWLLRGLRPVGTEESLRAARESARLRADLRALVRKVRNMDDRLSFQEQLLGGASPLESAPEPLPHDEEADALAAGEEEKEDADAADADPDQYPRPDVRVRTKGPEAPA